MIKNNRFSFYTIDNPWDIRGGRDGGGGWRRVGRLKYTNSPPELLYNVQSHHMERVWLPLTNKILSSVDQ